MKPAFPEISKIPYEGPTSKIPLAFKEYDPTSVIENLTMAEHLRNQVKFRDNQDSVALQLLVKQAKRKIH